VDERVVADRTLLTAPVRGEEHLYLHDRQVTDPDGRRGVNDFTVLTAALYPDGRTERRRAGDV